MTVSTLAQIIAGVQDVVGVISGIRLAPDIPPEQLAGGGVFAVVYPAAGRFDEITTGRLHGEHTLHVMVATPLRNLRTDWERVISYGTSVPAALLASGTLSGTVLQNTRLRYTFGPLEWGGQPLIGWLFEFDVESIGSLS